ncbi:mitochondrial inner membrane protease subunit 2 [Sodiomyces alkalinus F11]|uniref:Mitochondrial inner membrane protease subunit 2 n=1 Tax=Sodiomyces alkalinus (strain CBS 110278 / VKM F-3762 / F11) TaxID=1314773 RepID=A0A3N2PY61_SODAK|nr:mitochondrial inner membrane protease subunit 2 [Sodiomyces alkalinus F11]ROT39422.1 mitochondrial inner membrane protease subunit 2 [Sodiomyces alkalinus F11]
MALSSIWRRGGWQRAFFGDLTVRLFGFASWIPLIIWVRYNVADISNIHGPSMFPFLNEDIDTSWKRDVVLNWKWDCKQNLHRGMVVTFRSPYSPETVVVKRIIALEGDLVRTRPPYPDPVVKVPQGHVWVEGDGPEGKSIDSNTYGPIAIQLITGRVTHILYPWRKFGSVKWWEYKPRPWLPSSRDFEAT